MKKLIKYGISNELINRYVNFIYRLRKVFIVIALISILWNYLPLNLIKVKAKDYENEKIVQIEDKEKLFSTTDSDFKPYDVTIEEEVISERTLTSKTFRKVDGSYEIALYNNVIHYKNGNKLEEIDNRLVFNKNNDEYENNKNDYKIKFPKKLKSNKSIKLSKDKYQIEWSISNINTSEIDYNEKSFKSNNIKDISHVNQSVIYKNIQNNVDIEYDLIGDKIKENIILNKYIQDFILNLNIS